jgi:hypothetical protein
VSADIHPTTIELNEAPPKSLAVDEWFTVTVKVCCPDGCELLGLPVAVTAPDGAGTKSELAHWGDGANETAAIALKVPQRVGDHAWSIDFPEHERDGVRHAASALSIAVKAEPHATSLAVWNIPSPVVVGMPFAIKVGAKSTSGCTLHGKTIEVCDAAGAVLARGEFGETPWPGTAEGILAWSARFAGAGLDLPHEGASSGFSFAAVPPPEHTLTVKVVEKDTSQPIEDVQVLLGAYRAATGASGLADLRLPKGTYELAIWKVGYEADPRTLTVDADLAVEIAATVVPEDDPDALWQM